MHWLSLKKIPLAELKQQLLSPSRQHSSFWALLYSFTLKQAWASLFGGLLLGFIVLFHFVYPRDAWLSQNDALTLVAIAIQVLMLAFKLETFKELRVILLFHLVGTVMELFKTSMGSWTYGAGGVCTSVPCRCLPALCMGQWALIWSGYTVAFTCALAIIRRNG